MDNKKSLAVREVFVSKVELHKMSRLMWTNHLFHRYNWCHVIDIIVQLYVIVGLGIKLKSMSVRSWLEVDFICLEILILQQGCSSKGESEPCPCVCHDRCIWLPVFFSYFFCHSFVDSVAFSIEFCQNVHSLSIEKVWRFWMEKKSQVSEQNFTEAKLFIIYIVFCNV